MTILGWMVYAVAVGLLLSAAAWLLDRGLVRIALPTRWIWLGVMALTVGLPFAAIPALQPDGSLAEEAASIGDVLPATAESVRAGAEGDASPLAWGQSVLGLVGRLFDRVSEALNGGLAAGAGVLSALVSDPVGFSRWMVALWAFTSMGLALVLCWGPTRLRHRARGWPEARAQGRSVRISPDFGPAAIGVVKPEIVLPRWGLALPAPDLSLVLDHEEAHVRARDPLVLVVGVAALVAIPWNPALWWQLRRLRDAVEVDCDRRVLRGQAGPALYGRVLVEIGAHGRMDVLLTPAISGTRSLLERRLMAMRERSKRRELPRTLAVMLVAIALIAVACDALPPLPLETPTEELRPDVAGSDPDAPPSTPTPTPSPSSDPEPTGVPTTPPAPGVAVVPPDPYPASTNGTSQPPAIVFPEPPPSSSAPTAPGSGLLPPLVPGGTAAPQVPPPSSQVPTFTPYEIAPEVRNVEQVRQALTREYPPVLRDAGIGGRVVMWFFIDDRGVVENVQVNQSSGVEQLDDAASSVARIFQFTPAVNEGRPVAVWISIPITFVTER